MYHLYNTYFLGVLNDSTLKVGIFLFYFPLFTRNTQWLKLFTGGKYICGAERGKEREAGRQ